MLNIPRLDIAPGTAPADFHQQVVNAVGPQKIGHVNWPAEFPYAPQVHFFAAHNGAEVLLVFEVQEEGTMALTAEDNGPVWTDSCCEFFIAFDGSGYYNFEFNCIGTALAAFRKEKPNATHGSPELMQSIRRESSLGRQPFAEKQVGGWRLAIAIPSTAFFKHRFASLDGVEATANFYKCGDNLSKPHFLSWAPVGTPSPNFHVPQFFAPVRFE